MRKDSEEMGTFMDNEKVYQMDFAKIYQLLVNKATKKGRTKAEVDEVIHWLPRTARPVLPGCIR